MGKSRFDFDQLRKDIAHTASREYGLVFEWAPPERVYYACAISAMYTGEAWDFRFASEDGYEQVLDFSEKYREKTEESIGKIGQGQRALWVILVTWVACALRWFRVESLHVVRVGTGHGE
jgi:hypothetical protein